MTDKQEQAKKLQAELKTISRRLAIDGNMEDAVASIKSTIPKICALFQEPEKCPECGGEIGYVTHMPHICPTCKGTGIRPMKQGNMGEPEFPLGTRRIRNGIPEIYIKAGADIICREANPQPVTEQELREQISNRLALDFFIRCLRLKSGLTVLSEAQIETDSILSLIKQAGYKSPEEITDAIIEQFPRMASEMGYVRMAEQIKGGE